MDALRLFAPTLVAEQKLAPSSRSMLERVLVCRTPALGGHRYACDGCGYNAVRYNSCRSRYCPQCQGPRRKRWLEAQQKVLLPTPHFQVVFTLPSSLRGIAKRWPRPIYDLLFQSAQQTLQTLAQTHWKATPAILAVLHTWNREMKLHPHVHCVVSAGGLASDGAWVASGTEHLFPVVPMRRLFRMRFREGFRALGLVLDREQRRQVARARTQKDWVAFVEAPKNRDPEHLVKYLARYVYSHAISDSRMVSVTDTNVTFRTRGDGVVSVPGTEFARRFAQHVLPKGFRKIRHYGLLAPGNRLKLDLARSLVTRGQPATPPEPTPAPTVCATGRCPDCGEPLRRLLVAPVSVPEPAPLGLARGPP
jgi:hypothetical protein